MRGGTRLWTLSLVLLSAFALACRRSERVARAALDRFSRPAMGFLHRLTAPVPFPLAEVLAIAIASAAAFALLCAAARALRGRRWKPLGRWCRGMLWTALLLGGGLVLLWEPARSLPEETIPAPEAGQLEWLCGELVGALNGAALDFPAPAEALRLAPGAAGLPGCAVKAVRYPEWMDAAGIWGLFVPLTGEALADDGAPAPLVPFTAVHELMHLTGVADEGAANIAAWRLCLEAGGPFADSARLWALRYAAGMLGQRDPYALQRVCAKMEGALARAFREINGEIIPGNHPRPGIPGLSLSRGDYAALVGWLAEEMTARQQRTQIGPSA